MSNKNLTILALIAIITTILAVWLSMSKKTSSSDPTNPRYLIGNIEPSLINEIQIGSGDDTVTLKRSGKQFLVKNKDNYPAKVSEINDLLRTCIDVQISELYTDNASNHKALGVLEENSISQVKFIKADGTLLTGIIIGNTKEGGLGTYIRQPESDNVYLTLNNPQIRKNALDYIDNEITSTDISKENIESVSITQAGERYSLNINEQGQVVPDQVQAGKTLKDDEANKVFTALSNLRFTDVAKDTEALAFNKSFTCRLSDDTVYTLFSAEKDGKTYITCNANYQGKLPPPSQNFATQEELKDKEAKYLARDKAVEFSRKHTGWMYEISNDSARNLTKTLNDLFKEPEESETEVKPNLTQPPLLQN